MPSVSWRRNLYIMFGVEAVVLMAFGFANPFMPMFIQSMGEFTDSQAAFWSGLTGTAFGIAMFLTGPIWGIIADRWGRKPMVLRAMFGIAALSAATALAPNVGWLIAARAAQGLFAGSMSAASALVAGSTPRDKIPFAMGLLMVASFGGNAVGPLLGGALADLAGYRAVFYIIGFVYFVGALAVLFLVKENFRPLAKEQTPTLSGIWNLGKSRALLPLLIVLCVLTIGPSMIQPIIPLYIEQLTVKDVATASGLAFSLMGIVASVSSIVAGRMGGRISLKKMMVFASIGTGLLYLPPLLASNVGQFIALMSLRGLLNGGIMIPPNALIALSVSETQQGMAYGLQQSANSLGNGLGPILGGTMADVLGLKAVFPAAAVIFLVAGVAVWKLLPEVNAAQLKVVKPARMV